MYILSTLTLSDCSCCYENTLSSVAEEAISVVGNDKSTPKKQTQENCPRNCPIRYLSQKMSELSKCAQSA